MENERKDRSEEMQVYAKQLATLQEELMSNKTTQTQDRTQIPIPVSEKFSYSAQNYGKNSEVVKKEEIDNLKVIFL